MPLPPFSRTSDARRTLDRMRYSAPPDLLVPPNRMPDSPLTFRPAVPADVDALVVLVESAYRGDTSRAGWTTEADLLEGQRTDAAALVELLTAPASRIVLAESGGRIVASVLLTDEGGSAYLGMFAVHPPFQGGGIGRRLLEEAERQAREDLGVPVARMTVIAQRPELIAWYERRGYRQTGEREPFPYGDERFGRPQRSDLYFVVMKKALSR